MKQLALAIAAMLMMTACSQTAASSSSEAEASSSPAPSLVLVEEEEMQTREESILEMLTRTAKMLDQMEQNGNQLISPVSLYSALGMTMNGASGETLQQMETILGMTAQELNAFCAELSNTAELKTANSIWYSGGEKVSNGFSVKPQQAFLEQVENSYRAEVIGCDFSDGKTVDQINGWVSENTDGMIPQLIDRIMENTVMMLINTTLFDGLWVKPYQEYQIQKEIFTLADGTEKNVDLMVSTEGYYLENEVATGFVKFYQNGYRFVAVLPKETGDFTLEGLSLGSLIESTTNYPVEAKMPSFTFESSMSFVDTLKEMGMVDAFTDSADFSRMLEGAPSVCVSEIIQKAKIDLTAEGTKAAAATVVSVKATAAAPSEKKIPKQVILNRPFAFLILDPEGVPLFLGKVMNPDA